MNHTLEKFRAWMGMIAAACAVTLILSIASCTKHVAILTPLQNVQLTTDQALAVIAHSAHAAETSARQLDAQGIITDKALTRAILTYCEEAAKVVATAEGITHIGQTPQQVAAGVLGLLQQIQQLPAPVQAFVGSPTNRQEVTALVGLLTDVVNAAVALAKQQQAIAATAPVVPVGGTNK